MVHQNGSFVAVAKSLARNRRGNRRCDEYQAKKCGGGGAHEEKEVVPGLKHRARPLLHTRTRTGNDSVSFGANSDP